RRPAAPSPRRRRPALSARPHPTHRLGDLAMRYYLGLGGSKHDFATCLVGGGTVLAAIEEERITRKKRGYGVPPDGPLAGVRYCLDLAGITMADVDAVLVNDLLEPWSYETLGKDTHV